MTDERAAELLESWVNNGYGEETTAVIRRAAHVLRTAAPMADAALALVEAVVDDYSADHHRDDCPGDCEEHAVGHLINEAHGTVMAYREGK